MVGAAEDGDRIAVLAGGYVAQREGLADHIGCLARNRRDALDELIAKAALEESRRDRCG
jgi:hypothetical protein